MISWIDDKIVDWSRGGITYSLDGKVSTVGKYHFAFSFDSAINSPDGKYAFIYKRLGTKGLLLKNGEELREIIRSYYCAGGYDYPVAFATLSDQTTILIHCPSSYDRLEFEDVETGKILTQSFTRRPFDIFYSRLEVSPNNKYFISKGWVWQPWEVLDLYEIDACIANPLLLDNGKIIPKSSTEICTASFIDNTKVLVGTSLEGPKHVDKNKSIPAGHLAVWDFIKNKVTDPIKVNGEFGNVIAINDEYCWDLYKYPKIINIGTGEVEDQMADLFTGLQKSSINLDQSDNLPLIAYNRQLQKLAFKNKQNIEILWRD